MPYPCTLSFSLDAHAFLCVSSFLEAERRGNSSKSSWEAAGESQDCLSGCDCWWEGGWQLLFQDCLFPSDLPSLKYGWQRGPGRFSSVGPWALTSWMRGCLCAPGPPSLEEQTPRLKQSQLQDTSHPCAHMYMQVTSQPHALTPPPECLPFSGPPYTPSGPSLGVLSVWAQMEQFDSQVTRGQGCDHRRQPKHTGPILMGQPNEGLPCSLFMRNTDSWIESKAVFSEWGRDHAYRNHPECLQKGRYPWD